MVRSVSGVLILAGALLAGSIPARATTATGPADAPRVVATIKPVHALVAAVMTGVADPDLLLEGVASPHSFQLSPDHIKRLSKADVVFLINRRFEVFLQSSLESLVSKQAKIIELSQLPGVVLRPLRPAPLGDSAATGLANVPPVLSPIQSGGSDNQVPDFHIWLSIQNAVAVTNGISAALCRADPAHCPVYEKNAADYTNMLRREGQRLDRKLAGARGRGYVISHDSIQYFEMDHDLGRGIAILSSPDGLPSARRLRDLRRLIDARAIDCLLLEPQFPRQLADVVAEGKDMRVAEIDILGAGLPAGAGTYVTILDRLADGLIGCLG